MTWIKILSNIWKMHHFLRHFPILIMMMATHFAKLHAIASSAIAVGLKSIWKPSCSVRSIKSIRSVRSLPIWEAGRWLVPVNEYWSVSWWGNKERDIFMEGSHLLTGDSYPLTIVQRNMFWSTQLLDLHICVQWYQGHFLCCFPQFIYYPNQSGHNTKERPKSMLKKT